MQWILVPANKIKYSEEVMDFARAAALQAMKSPEFDIIDFENIKIGILGEKWENKFSHINTFLNGKYEGQLHDLLALSRRAITYAHQYETALISKGKNTAAALSNQENGNFLAQHYYLFCEDMRLTGFKGSLPVIGDILKAVCLDNLIQAAKIIEKDLERALDLLFDASRAAEIADAGENKVRSFFEYKEAKKKEVRKNGGKGAEKRHSSMNTLCNWVIDKYKIDVQEKKWKSGNAAAHDLLNHAIEHGKTIGASLTKTNGQRTIAKWINDHLKSV